jgi:2-polyprenyl-3-methyl-5-hydroxy-6-metoxy-1,4-benzoquinol methylase
VPQLIARINQFNAAHPWSHNDFYRRWVLRQLPRRLSRSVDLGCGTGNLVRALAARSAAAEGIDADPAVIAVARQIPGTPPHARFSAGDLLGLPAAGSYDAVTAVAVIHHLPLEPALEKARSLLAPRGTLVIIGCYRPVTFADRATGLLAVPANMVMGLLKSRGQAQARVAMSACTADPVTSLPEIRATAARLLPGARIRRRLFWRYSLRYTVPG